MPTSGEEQAVDVACGLPACLSVSSLPCGCAVHEKGGQAGIATPSLPPFQFLPGYHRIVSFDVSGGLSVVSFSHSPLEGKCHLAMPSRPALPTYYYTL